MKFYFNLEGVRFQIKLALHRFSILLVSGAIAGDKYVIYGNYNASKESQQ